MANSNRITSWPAEKFREVARMDVDAERCQETAPESEAAKSGSNGRYKVEQLRDAMRLREFHLRHTRKAFKYFSAACWQ